MQVPLTYEQVWGERKQICKFVVKSDKWCPYREIECGCWENGCQTDLCIYSEE